MGGDANKRFEMLFEVEPPPPPDPEPNGQNVLIRPEGEHQFPSDLEGLDIEGNLSVENSFVIGSSYAPETFTIDGGGNPVRIENTSLVRVDNLQALLEFPTVDLIEIGQAVTLDSTGSAVLCHGPLDYNQGTPLGICVEIRGGTVSVAYQGRVQCAGWAWTPGEPIFVASDGGLTDVPPDYGYVCQVGMAIEAETVVLNLPVSFITGVR